VCTSAILMFTWGLCTAAAQDHDAYADYSCQMGYTTSYYLSVSSGADIK
jgi:hypothetical protein